MRMPPRKYLIGGAALALLGAGVAQAATAKLHTMKIDAPDGSVVQVQYAGDVAPKVEVLPVDAVSIPAAMPVMADPFAEMERVSAVMDAQMQAMMQRAAAMQQQAAASGKATEIAPGFTVVGDMPGNAQFSYVSTTTDANGCTRTVSYSSDGSGAAPKMAKAASDGCDAVKQNDAAIPARAEQPAQPVAPGQTV